MRESVLGNHAGSRCQAQDGSDRYTRPFAINRYPEPQRQAPRNRRPPRCGPSPRRTAASPAPPSARGGRRRSGHDRVHMHAGYRSTPPKKKGRTAAFFDFEADFGEQIRPVEITGGYRPDSRIAAGSEGHIVDMRADNFSRMFSMARPGICRLRASVRVVFSKDSTRISDI